MVHGKSCGVQLHYDLAVMETTLLGELPSSRLRRRRALSYKEILSNVKQLSNGVSQTPITIHMHLVKDSLRPAAYSW